jgi:hypothetical protein
MQLPDLAAVAALLHGPPVGETGSVGIGGMPLSDSGGVVAWSNEGVATLLGDKIPYIAIKMP